MKVFVTGASGYIGGSVAAGLVAAGHEVSGLARSEEKAEALRGRDIEPVMGDLESAEVLSAAAAAADGVVNAAHADHRGAAEALLAGLEGSSGKVYIQTSGSSVVADLAAGQAGEAVYDEDSVYEPLPARAGRVAINEMIMGKSETGLRSVVIAPTLIYGEGRGLNPNSIQIPWLVALAKQHGRARHIGPGGNIWANVHIDDLVDLYLLALEKAPGGAFYYAENGENSMPRGLRSDQRRARLSQPAGRDERRGSRRGLGRGPGQLHHGLQQPRQGETRAGRTGLGASTAVAAGGYRRQSTIGHAIRIHVLLRHERR